FDVSAAADAVDPGAFAKDFPGSLNLRAQASGRLAGESFKGNINIARLDGRFMGYPVAAAGKLTVDKNDVQVEALTLRSDRNRLAADGRLNPDAADLRFEIDAPDLATVWPGLKGSVRGEGSIKGKYADPLLVTQLAAKGVSFQDYSVKRLDLTLDYAEALAKPSGVTVEAEDLAIAGQRIERFTLKGQGSLRKHRFDARLDAPIVNVRTVIAGGWDNQRWDGAVETLVLEHPQLSRWQLSAPWPLTVARQGQSVAVNLAEGCLQQGKAAICTQLSGSPDGRLESRTELRRIALGLFKPWLPEDLALAGHFSAQAQAVKDGGDIDAKLQLRMPEATATIARKDQTPLTVPFTETRLDADYRQKRLNADLKVGLGGTDFVQAELSAGPGATGVPIPLSGRVTASVTDFSVADALLPQIEQLTGRFDADLTLAGDTSKPVINGSGRLSGGAFKVPLAGIAVDNIGLTAAGDPNRPEHLTLTGEAHSGKGRLALTGTLDLDEAQGFPLQLRVAGENFEVAKLPQAEVELSPELNIEQAPDGIVVNGKVRVARAKIELTEIPESAITPSEDEVIVGAEPTAEAAAKPSRIRTDIEILLGDDVGFSGYGLTTKLAGKLHYTGTGRQTVMQGRVAMSDAKYKAYGQDLTLTKGEFLFNGPVDNPWLNIEATRKATGEDVTAILRVTGPLKAPQSKVSTDPALPESEALAYLLTGHSLERIGSSQSDTLAKAAFSYGAGQLSWLSDQMGIDEFDVEESERLEDSAVKLGKYITPDFYIGLSLGFFSNNYAVLLKHQLTRHFSLQTRAGETQRIDLKYQLDSD
ncbi:MAG: translocation/assembly module TamB domain-containing protein, partial [Gammaproteobacteria bacterium]